MITDLNDEDLEKRLQETKGLMGVAFFDYVSIPCQHFQPELEAVAEKFDGKVKFYQINAVENPIITEKLGVETVPTLVMYRGSEEIARYEGPYSREAVIERVNVLLGRKKRK